MGNNLVASVLVARNQLSSLISFSLFGSICVMAVKSIIILIITNDDNQDDYAATAALAATGGDAD